ncbi:zinc finger protein 804A-like [Xenopus laevis]|uniref:Zinc finger protein 804A-like n=2 Tax=Xenopus laevis TaxID=8355 RepID=A0A1L8EPH9_XENLA|nr:zinc finger protein 804A-like [Xenopus laevis]OCT61225.1 hypothetical protein XELAEV_18047248mg [Xenopus laevis]
MCLTSLASLSMECYYIVISSSHLSNGHFRNIKGVFRGPLTHSTTLDCAEKETTRSKTLKDLKANFYCDLCDKQYHKHQEFDNHINSYDHAHKQRLKELKQREFARNVASKLRKHERKQKKYLHQLHSAAHLKREATCAPGSGPMFKSTTVSIQNHIHGDIQDDLVQSEGHCFKSIHEKTSVMPMILAENSKQHFDRQTKKGHKFSFSFAFPKKAQIKLESSAAVFYEFNDDISAERRLKRRSRFVPESFTALSALPADVLQCPSNTQQSIAVSLNHSLDNKHEIEPTLSKLQSALAAEVFLFPSSDQHATTGLSKQTSNKVCCLQDQNLKQMLTSVVNVFPDPDICHIKVPQYSGVSGAAATMTCSKLTTCMQEVVKDTFAVIDIKSRTTDSEVTIQETHYDESAVPNKAQQNENTAVNQSENRHQENKNVSHFVSPSSDNMTNSNEQRKDGSFKRPSHAFFPVQSKDGSTVLQWPSEMLMHTCTEPSISYSCNPLYFDFRASKYKVEQKNIKNVQRTHPCNLLCPTWKKITNKSFNTKFNRNSISREPEGNMKRYKVICFVNGNKKHISSSYLDKIYHLDTKCNRNKTEKCKKHDHKCKMRQYRCKHDSQEKSGRSLKCKYRHRWSMNNHGVNICNSLSTRYVDLKGSPGSIDDRIPFRHMPETEGTTTDRSPALQMKPQCRLLNRKAEFENLSQNNMASLRYQLGMAPIKHGCENVIYSCKISNLKTNKASSSHQKADTQRRLTLKRKHSSFIDEPKIQCKKHRLWKPFSLSIQQITFSEQNYFVLWKAIHRKLVGKIKGDISANGTLCRSFEHKFPKYTNGKLETYHKWQKMSFKSAKCLNNINKSKENTAAQLWDGLPAISDNKAQCLLAVHIADLVTKHEITSKQRISEAPNDPCAKQGNSHGSNTAQEQQSLSPNRRTGKEPGSSRSCMKCAALEFTKQAYHSKKIPNDYQSYHTGQFRPHVSLPHAKSFPLHPYTKKHYPCAGYRHKLQPCVFPGKLKIVFPSTAAQSCSSLYPVLYEQPFCSTTSTMVQRTFTHHHVTVLSAACFAAASTDNRASVDFPHQFLSQAYSRVPLYQVTGQARLCPVDHVFSLPQAPVVPTPIHHCLPLPFPPISHTTVLPPLHIPQPSLIPLQSIF